MRLVRGNSFVHLEGAPPWFLQAVGRHLSIRLEIDHPTGDSRFGGTWWHEGELHGSLLLGEQLPVGLLRHAHWLAGHYGVACEYVDARGPRPAPAHAGRWARDFPAWRDYQDRIHAAALERAVGVIHAPPRSGKTAMLARLIDALGLPVLYLAPAVAIVAQTYRVLCRHFGEERVARVDGTTSERERDLSKMIVVATVPSALKLPPEFFATRRVLALDESHHAASESYHVLGGLCSGVYYRYSFTGTHWRTADDRLAMDAVSSAVIAEVPVAELVPRYLATPLLAYVPFFARPFPATSWQAAYDLGIVQHEERNELVAGYARQYAAEKIPTLVVTQRRRHADLLGEMIAGSRVAKGGEGVLTSRTIDAFRAGEFPVLIGTSVLGEGVDVPSAGALIYAAGLGDSVTMMQSYFRPLTAHPGKERGFVVDFADNHHPTLQRQSQDRRRLGRAYLGPWLAEAPGYRVG